MYEQHFCYMFDLPHYIMLLAAKHFKSRESISSPSPTLHGNVTLSIINDVVKFSSTIVKDET